MILPSPKTSPSPSPAPTAKLRVSLSTGETLAIELPSEIEKWDQVRVDPAFQARIRGLVLVLSGQSYALPAPRAFRHVSYTVEVLLEQDPGAEAFGAPAAIRAGYTADDVTSLMTLYLKGNPPMVRFDTKRTGRLRWSPT